MTTSKSGGEHDDLVDLLDLLEDAHAIAGSLSEPAWQDMIGEVRALVDDRLKEMEESE